MPRTFIRRALRNWHVKLVSIALAVLLWIYVGGLKEKDRFITVPFEIRNITPGYTVSSDTPSHVKIILRGTEENLALVKETDIRAYVEVERGRRGRNRGVVRVDRNAIPPGVGVKEVSPRFVDLTVENLVTRMVRVSPVIVGRPKAGFVLTDVQSTPAGVLVRGPSTLVGRLGNLYTESISIEGLERSVVRDVGIRTGDGRISLADSTQVTVTVTIDEEFAVMSYEGLTVEIMSLRNGLGAHAVPATAAVVVKVPRRLDASLSAENLHVYVDGESADRSGTFELPLLFRTDIEGVSLIRTEPQRVRLIVEALRSGRM